MMPRAMPSEIEYMKAMDVMQMKAGIACSGSSQPILTTCWAMKKPTTIKAGAVAAGACAAVPRGESAGPRRGIGVGLAYMGLGVLLYALLSGQRFEPLAYALDLGMGAAAGGLTGMLRAGMEPKAKSA